MAYVPAWQRIQLARESLRAEAHSDAERLDRLERTMTLTLDAMGTAHDEAVAASWPANDPH